MREKITRRFGAPRFRRPSQAAPLRQVRVRPLELDTVELEHPAVLLDQRVLGLHQDPDERFLVEAGDGADDGEPIAGGVRLADIRESSCDKMDAQVPKIIPALMMMDADYMRLQPLLSKSQQVLDTPSKCIVRIPASLARQICETSKAQITSP